MAVLSKVSGEYELKNIAVHPEWQGRGIAKSIISAVKNRAQE
jgi:ribosomal protein S18 acetylase RimI-like enzyme